MRIADPNNEYRKNIMIFVKEFWSMHKYAPTVREIGEACGISSTSVVNHHVNMLVKAGKLERGDFVQRSITRTDMKITFVGDE